MQEVTKFYPVLIPTLNRYEHFKKCVESLSRNTHADKTELVIGLDYPPCDKYEEGYLKIKSYIPTINGFEKVTVIEHNKNVGAGENIKSLREYANKHYEASISTEDDNEFAPNFLDYMNKALSKYEHDSNVLSVSGYCHPDFQYDGESTTCFSYEVSAWGIGFWRSKMPSFDKKDNRKYFEDFLLNIKLSFRIMRMCPSVFNMLPGVMHYNLPDVKLGIYNMIEGTTQLRPTKTLVKNWGYDGSGVNCNSSDKRLEEQCLSNDVVFRFTKTVLSANSLECNRYYRSMNVPKKLFKRYKYYFAVYRNYFSYLLRHL